MPLQMSVQQQNAPTYNVYYRDEVVATFHRPIQFEELAEAARNLPEVMPYADPDFETPLTGGDFPYEGDIYLRRVTKAA